MFFYHMIQHAVFTAKAKTQLHFSPTQLFIDKKSLCFTT